MDGTHTVPVPPAPAWAAVETTPTAADVTRTVPAIPAQASAAVATTRTAPGRPVAVWEARIIRRATPEACRVAATTRTAEAVTRTAPAPAVPATMSRRTTRVVKVRAPLVVSPLGELSFADAPNDLDSTAGKLMEKAGGMFHSEKMEEKGAAKREQARYGGNNNDDY